MHLKLIQSRSAASSAEQRRRLLRCNALIALVCVSIVFVLMTCEPIHIAHAQTHYTARPATHAPGNQIAPVIAKPAQDGFTVIVWQDNRDAGDANIYAQMLDNLNGLPQWYPPDGVPVCTAPGLQRNPVASFDSSGGVIICWEDFRNVQPPIDQHSISEIYAQRLLLIDGSAEATWGATNVNTPVCAGTDAIARDVRIAGTTDGAFFTWTDYRNSSGYPYYDDKDVYAHYLLTATASWPGGTSWEQNGINVPANTAGDQTLPVITLDHVRRNDSYGIYLAFEDASGGTRQIRVMNINADGTVEWEDLAAATGSDQRAPRIASTGSFTLEPLYGAIVAWEDARDYVNAGYDVHAQCIDESGTVWGQSVVVCDAPEDQGAIALAARLDVAALAWEDARDFVANDLDVYGNIVDMNTAQVWYPSDAGAELSVNIYDQRKPDVDITLDGQWITMCWEDQRLHPSDPSNIYAESFSPGDPPTRRWGVGGTAVSAAKEAQILPKVANNVVAWQDARRAALQYEQTADENIYAQRLGGECDLPTELMWRSVYVQSNPDRNAHSHRMAVDAYGHQYISWIEERWHGQTLHERVFVQKVDRDGVPRWSSNGVLLGGVSDPATQTDVCIDDMEGCFVTWVEGGNQVKVARVDYDGDVVQTLDVGTGDTPRIVENDAGGLLLGYFAANRDLQLVHYDDALNVVDDRSLTSGGNQWSGLKMSKDREGGAWLVWYEIGVDYLGSHYDGASDPLPERVTGFFESIAEQFDIDTDYLPSSLLPGDIARNKARYDCLFAGVGVKGSPVGPPLTQQDVLVARLVADYDAIPPEVDWFGEYDLSDNDNNGPGTNYNAMHPAISADSLAGDWSEPYAPEIGGALISWTNEYIDPNVQQLRYEVRSSHRQWMRNYVLGPPGNSYLLDGGRTHESRSDIAVRQGGIEKSSESDQALGVVVWSSSHTGGCLTPVALRAQLIDYSDADPQTALKWGQVGTPVARLYGTTEQIEPLIVAVSPGSDALEGHALPVLWSDSRSGTRCLLLTRIFDVDGELSWRKDVAHDAPTPTEPRLLQGYPHPVSLSRHGGFTIPYTIDRDAEAVVLLRDILGRQTLRLPAMTLTAGASSLTIPASVYRSVAPGLYILSVLTASTQLHQTIVLIR
jgi:hypothetical protein